MTDLDALLAAVLAHPEEDTPRLLYADALQERGDEKRAEFIRVQIGLERGRVHSHAVGCPRRGLYRTLLPDDFPRGGKCHRCSVELACIRDAELRATPAAAVPNYGSLPRGPDGPFYLVSRGFVEHVECTPDAWLEHGPAVVRKHPVARVDLPDLFIDHVVSGPHAPAWYVGYRHPLNFRVNRFFRERWHPTVYEAQAALSDACLAWAKSAT